MIKRAVVEIGKTPSELSGDTSTKLTKDGSALKEDEKLESSKIAKIAMQKLVIEENKKN
jgi:hypothetical protein